MRHTSRLLSFLFIIALFPGIPNIAAAAQSSSLSESSAAWPSINLVGLASLEPMGLTPQDVRDTYRLSRESGTGTIAIITAYRNPNIESDLERFNAVFGLRSCTSTNGCFERHSMSTTTRQSSGWALQAALDTQWAHAIAPQAKILLVEAKSAARSDLSSAESYVHTRPDVRGVSTSWDTGEPTESLGNPPDLREGYSVYYSNPSDIQGNWYVLGGPTAEIAQRAAVKAIDR